MPEKKKRTRTGCLTCRSRRIKCDELKPACGRCTAANIACAGYQRPRVVVSKYRLQSSATPPTLRPPVGTARPNNLGSVKPYYPLIAFPNNPADYQIPHRRAREVLGHQQFTARTVHLLFRHDHLYFWRDQLMQTAWDNEYVFDAIITVGTMHRAVLLLSKHNDQFRGTDVRSMALEYYGRTLRQVAEIYGHDYNQTCEILIAVLLLLTYFECFSGNVTGALRHLCVAQQHLSSLEALHALDGSSMPNRDALVACANDLAMTARITLPLAPITLSLSIDTVVPRVVFGGAETVEEEFQQLIALIRADTVIRTACWRPLGYAAASTSVEDLVAFQETLRGWKLSAEYSNQDSAVLPEVPSESPIASPAEHACDIPPPPKHFSTIKAALGVALFNCYMGRTMQLRSQAGDANAEDCARQAEKYAYENLCITQGLWKENDQRPLEERVYLPYERIQIGLTPLLYLGTHFCRQPSWIAWSKEKLRSIGQEGIYNSLALAAALDLGAQLEQLDACETRSMSDISHPDSTGLIVIPDTEGRCFVAYLLRRLRDSSSTNSPKVRIVGSARWDATALLEVGDVELLLLDDDHPLNKATLTEDPYSRVASYEAFALEWKALLAEPTYSPAAYLPTDFDLSNMLEPATSRASVPVLAPN